MFNSADLIRSLRKLRQDIRVKPVPKGTLGVCFSFVEEGKRRFLKTHLPLKTCRKNLSKESDILMRLYGKDLFIQTLEVEVRGESFFCLIMDELQLIDSAQTIDDILALTVGFGEKLADYPNRDLVKEGYAFQRLLKEGYLAVDHLAGKGLLNNDIANRALAVFSRIEHNLNHFKGCLCHGDLGPKNIMTKQGKTPVVIDWEDAFWGIEGYDYLYWLTFFSNRKLYSPHIFGKTPWDKEIDVAILTLILVLKCELSVRANSYHQNSMNFNERLMDVLDL